ncbi:MAG: hypothetical protein OXK80_02075 [Bdellovibrionales bacterium]|nr:hypothetical protein [Bdellovibrionales bacterium]
MKRILVIFSLIFCVSAFSFELEDLIGEWKEMGFTCIDKNSEFIPYNHHRTQFLEMFDEDMLFETRDHLDNLESSTINIDDENMVIESKFDTDTQDDQGDFCRARTVWSGSYRIQNKEAARAVDEAQNRRIINWEEGAPIVHIAPVVEYPLLVFTYTKSTKFYKQEGCPSKQPAEVSSGTLFVKFRVIHTEIDQRSLIFIPQNIRNTCLGDNQYLHFKFRKKKDNTTEVHG